MIRDWYLSQGLNTQIVIGFAVIVPAVFVLDYFIRDTAIKYIGNFILKYIGG